MKDYACAEQSLHNQEGINHGKARPDGGLPASHKAQMPSVKDVEATFTWRKMSDTMKARTPSNAKI